jgi:hypothetical protein
VHGATHPGLPRRSPIAVTVEVEDSRSQRFVLCGPSLEPVGARPEGGLRSPHLIETDEALVLLAARDRREASDEIVDFRGIDLEE